jgi:hypothetical protein
MDGIWLDLVGPWPVDERSYSAGDSNSPNAQELSRTLIPRPGPTECPRGCVGAPGRLSRHQG